MCNDLWVKSIKIILKQKQYPRPPFASLSKYPRYGNGNTYWNGPIIGSVYCSYNTVPLISFKTYHRGYDKANTTGAVNGSELLTFPDQCAMIYGWNQSKSYWNKDNHYFICRQMLCFLFQKWGIFLHCATAMVSIKYNYNWNNVEGILNSHVGRTKLSYIPD
jgi:hypothetical protein